MKLNKNIQIVKYNLRRSKIHKQSFCWAPFNTLRFSSTGQVLICCRNRYRVVGNIQYQSIEEI